MRVCRGDSSWYRRNSSECPRSGALLLDRSFGIDLHSLAALRIALGLVLLVDLAARVSLLSALYTDAGLLPRELIPEGACATTTVPHTRLVSRK